MSHRPGDASAPGRQVRPRRAGPWGGTLLTIVVVTVVFAGVLPRMADYAEAWALVRDRDVPSAGSPTRPGTR